MTLVHVPRERQERRKSVQAAAVAPLITSAVAIASLQLSLLLP